jgi:hypothetical protein
MRQILSKMEEQSSNEEDEEESNRRNATESSFEGDNSYIKIRRPRTESESETCSRRR